MRPFAGNEGRYATVQGADRTLWVRDQVTLQADVVLLLQYDGPMPKKRIITALGTTQAAIDTALEALLQNGTVARFKAMSARNRMDEHWRISAQESIALAETNGGALFKAKEILAGFHKAAKAGATRGNF
jgi:hypothetical protein